MNQIIEKITWMPYKLLSKIKQTKKNPLNLNFSNIGINKQFYFYTSPIDEGLSSQLRTFGFREPLAFEYYYRFIDSNDRALDIGANIGIFTILSEKAEKIVCVEPLKQLIPILEKNIEENNLSGKTEIVNAAVGNKGKLLIEVDEKLNLSKIVNKKNKKTQEIESIPLKDIVNKYDSNFFKLDVEGYEYEILYMKIPKKISKIFMEFHTALLGKKKVKELLNYFEEEGFKVKYLIEDLPIRMYPFHNFLKKIGLLKNFAYVKKNLNPNDCIDLVDKGRKNKSLFLER